MILLKEVGRGGHSLYMEIKTKLRVNWWATYRFQSPFRDLLSDVDLLETLKPCGEREKLERLIDP